MDFVFNIYDSMFLVKLQGLHINGGERVRDGFCDGSMLLASDCDSLFLVTFQEITWRSLWWSLL